MTHQHSTIDAPSHARLAKYVECERAYFYRYVLALRERGVLPTRPLAGRALHAAFDVLYREGYDAIDDAQRALIKVYDGHEPDPRFKHLTTEFLMGIVVGYVHRWPEDDPDFQPIKLHRSVLEGSGALVSFSGSYDAQGYAILNETPMVVRVAPGFTATVVIDLVVRRADGSVWVVDHKCTCRYLGDGVSGRYVVNHQLPLYIMAVRALIGECDGAILNGVHMGSAALSAASRATKFDRYSFDYTDGQLADSLEWARVVQSRARDHEAQHHANADEWVQNPSAYCSGCDYLQLCEVGKAVRAGRIASWYTEEEGADEYET